MAEDADQTLIALNELIISCAGGGHTEDALTPSLEVILSWLGQVERKEGRVEVGVEVGVRGLGGGCRGGVMGTGCCLFRLNEGG